MSYLLLGIRIAIALVMAAGCAYGGISVWAALAWRKSRPELQDTWTPDITILKPVRGVESPLTYDTFATFCQQDYPKDRLQILFGCLDEDDPVIPVIRRLQTEYPELSIDFVCAGPEGIIGPNRKVCNLISMLPLAKHDLLVLCDSDMHVQPDYLRRVVAPFEPGSVPGAKGVGLVTCPYRGYNPKSFAARLEALGIGAEFIPGALTSRALEGVGFALGSTIAITRRVLKEIGGFEAIVKELADDYRMGQAVRRAGYEVVLSDYVVDDVLGREQFRNMWDRRLRWARTVRACRPGGYAGMVVTHTTALALLFAASMSFKTPGLLVAGMVICYRLVTAAIVATITGDSVVKQSLWLAPVSDLFSFALYVASYCGNTIVWRGETFRLLPGGEMVKIPD